MKKTVLLGVTGSIAAYKILDLIEKLKAAKLEVFVVMTKSATKMIPASKFEKASGNPVAVELFEKDFDWQITLKEKKVAHVTLADKADVMVIAPATANIIAKLASGIADDFLTTTALATTAPIIICPAMNTNMWNNPATMQNIAKLKSLGFLIIEPTSGMLACGYEGRGRLMEVEEIKCEIIKTISYTNALIGQRVLVTSGATIEKIDDVRYITNRSSGKMGTAIAEECYKQGADVLLIRAKNSQTPRYLIKEELFATTQELFELIKKNIKNYDYIYHAAAVGDFFVKNPKGGKISSKSGLTLQLHKQIKIINQIKKLNPKIHLIAFKAEFSQSEKKLKEAAIKKLHESKADAIIANDISKKNSGFESDMNEVFIVRSKNIKHLPRATKTDLAKKIVTFLNQL
ncbi:MAG: bifunctional phosphopantothenoylcysteine decarboxylase/phosphopantothenate--cysteine ligase CoaBC [Candidatus Curtissbacteria bacterium]|nr:bifunctional phosphopantothenoylcysteine decarboxylase/phosphopantothenate--cysteine ligase CoaBC [Candidatus Curtissbacteria bacterium]